MKILLLGICLSIFFVGCASIQPTSLQGDSKTYYMHVIVALSVNVILLVPNLVIVVAVPLLNGAMFLKLKAMKLSFANVTKVVNAVASTQKTHPNASVVHQLNA